MNTAARLRHRILGGGLLLIASFAGSAAYDGWRLHQQVLSLHERELGNLARALAGEAARNLQAVDVLLRDTALWYERQPVQADASAINAELDARAVGAPQVSVLAIADATGRQLHRSRAAGVPLTDVSDRPYFLRQRDSATAGLVINAPLIARTEQQPAVVASRRLQRADGRFDGIVAATVHLESLRQAYAAIALGDGSALVLAQQDGTVLVQQPAGSAMQPTPALWALAERAEGPGVGRWQGPAEGPPQLAAVARVGQLPLVLAITRDVDEALRPWREEMRSTVSRTVLVSLLIALAMAALLRQLRRRDEAERERQRLEQRLQQHRRMEALGTLAGGIAHDFNNILGAILGFGEMAQQEATPGSAQRRHLDRVVQGGLRARQLVQGILDFSRTGVIEPQPVHMQSLMQELADLLTSTLPPGVSLHTELQAGHAAVQGDSTQLFQVAMNLCTNALQAMGDQGTLWLRLHRQRLHAPRALTQAELPAGDYLRMSVEDTGPGIAPEVLERMFEPFFTTKPPGQGTGLGLAVAHGIVQALGGAIDVATGPGQGTAIHVWLPTRGECAPPEQPQRTYLPQGAGQVVMVVDDEPALLELTEETLARLGYEPLGYRSAEDALQALHADPDGVDLVLSDETMPGLSGSAFAQRVKALRPELPVLLVSGRVDAALLQRAQAAGVQAVLRKPLSRQALAHQLAESLAAVR